MIRIDDLAIFVRAASVESFSAVAREMDLLPAQISASVKRLERELDIRLFARSTRNLRLTSEGEHYLPYARDVLAMLKEGRAGFQQNELDLQGTIQIASASDFGRNVLLPWLIEFQASNPGLTLRISLSDNVADIYRDPVDVAVRYGMVPNADFISLPLAPGNRRVIAASHQYISKNGLPETIHELSSHACLRFHLNGKMYDRWSFPGNGDSQIVTVSGPVISDDADVIRRCAIAGQGIIYKSWMDICDDVSKGLLQVVMPEQLGELFPLHFICPHRKQFSPATRLLYKFLKGKCESRLATH